MSVDTTAPTRPHGPTPTFQETQRLIDRLDGILLHAREWHTQLNLVELRRTVVDELTAPIIIGITSNGGPKNFTRPPRVKTWLRSFSEYPAYRTNPQEPLRLEHFSDEVYAQPQVLPPVQGHQQGAQPPATGVYAVDQKAGPNAGGPNRGREVMGALTDARRGRSEVRRSIESQQDHRAGGGPRPLPNAPGSSTPYEATYGTGVGGPAWGGPTGGGGAPSPATGGRAAGVQGNVEPPPPTWRPVGAVHERKRKSPQPQAQGEEEVDVGPLEKRPKVSEAGPSTGEAATPPAPAAIVRVHEFPCEACQGVPGGKKEAKTCAYENNFNACLPCQKAKVRCSKSTGGRSDPLAPKKKNAKRSRTKSVAPPEDRGQRSGRNQQAGGPGGVKGERASPECGMDVDGGENARPYDHNTADDGHPRIKHETVEGAGFGLAGGASADTRSTSSGGGGGGGFEVGPEGVAAMSLSQLSLEDVMGAAGEESMSGVEGGGQEDGSTGVRGRRRASSSKPRRSVSSAPSTSRRVQPTRASSAKGKARAVQADGEQGETQAHSDETDHGNIMHRNVPIVQPSKDGARHPVLPSRSDLSKKVAPGSLKEIDHARVHEELHDLLHRVTAHDAKLRDLEGQIRVLNRIASAPPPEAEEGGVPAKEGAVRALNELWEKRLSDWKETHLALKHDVGGKLDGVQGRLATLTRDVERDVQAARAEIRDGLREIPSNIGGRLKALEEGASKQGELWWKVDGLMSRSGRVDELDRTGRDLQRKVAGVEAALAALDPGDIKQRTGELEKHWRDLEPRLKKMEDLEDGPLDRSTLYRRMDVLFQRVEKMEGDAHASREGIAVLQQQMRSLGDLTKHIHNLTERENETQRRIGQVEGDIGRVGVLEARLLSVEAQREPDRALARQVEEGVRSLRDEELRTLREQVVRLTQRLDDYQAAALTSTTSATPSHSYNEIYQQHEGRIQVLEGSYQMLRDDLAHRISAWDAQLGDLRRMIDHSANYQTGLAHTVNSMWAMVTGAVGSGGLAAIGQQAHGVLHPEFEVSHTGSMQRDRDGSLYLPRQHPPPSTSAANIGSTNDYSASISHDLGGPAREVAGRRAGMSSGGAEPDLFGPPAGGSASGITSLNQSHRTLAIDGFNSVVSQSAEREPPPSNPSEFLDLNRVIRRGGGGRRRISVTGVVDPLSVRSQAHNDAGAGPSTGRVPTPPPT